MKSNDIRARKHPAWLAFIVHRLSGILLTVFLPIHFWTLGQALQGEGALDATLRWYDAPIFKFGEWALVLLLLAHSLGGLRLLLIEFRPWEGPRKGMISVAYGAAAVVSVVFLVTAMR